MPSASLPTGAALIRTAAIIESRHADACEREGITMQQMRILFIVQRQPSKMLGIGESLHLGKSTMTGVIARMEDADLVERSQDPDDRRALLVRPTERGAGIAQRIEETLRRDVGRLLRPLPAGDRADLGRLLTELIESADELGELAVLPRE